MQAQQPTSTAEEIPGKTPLGKLSREHVFVTAANTPLRNNLLRAFYATCKRAGIEGGWPLRLGRPAFPARHVRNLDD